MPGSGSVPYYLSKYTGTSTLFLTKRRIGKPVEPAPNVILKEIPFPEAKLRFRLGFLFSLFLAVFKIVGYSIFLTRSISYMTEFKPDIIHIHTPIPLLHGIFGKLFLRVKLVLTIHGTDFLRLKSEKLLKWCIWLWVDTIFFVSQSMSEELKRMFPGKRLVYTPNGVDIDKFYDQKRQRKKQLVAVGMLKWQKGYDYLLQSTQKVFLRYPEYRLVIVGDGPLRRHLEEVADNLGIARRIEFLKGLAYEQLARLLNESTIFVMSSVSEGFPRALVEAIACATPVVATDVGSCREIVDGVGLIVKPGDPQELEEAITRLIEDGALRGDFSRKCPEVAKRYDWKRTSEIVEREYRELIS